MTKAYRYALSLTSQFPFCGIPLRLDTYSRCQFACRYCFAAARGGNAGIQSLQIADPSALDRRLSRLAKGRPLSAIDEMLAMRVPIHFGGMSDPFIPIEEELGVSLKILRVLAAHRYPTVISTKSTLVGLDRYMEVLTQGRFIIQVSLATLNANLCEAVDVGAPSVEERLACLEHLSDAGLITACRIQPLLPGNESDAFDVIAACQQVGVRHVSLEHLKLPLENNWSHRRQLNDVLGFDLLKYYSDYNAERIGREWILPVARRSEFIIRARDYAHKMGLTFGAADNDLLHFSDGACCCSGADLLGFDSFFRFNFTEAVRSGLERDGIIRYETIAHQKRPNRSIAMFVNSKSRIPGASIEDYIRRNWNGRLNGNSPKMYFGVEDTELHDGEGLMIYRMNPEIGRLVQRS